MKQLLFCIMLCVTIVACKNKNTSADTIIASDKMEKVLWDIYQADAFTENFQKKDSSKNFKIENTGLQKKIFDLHKVSKESFYKSYQYYSSHPDIMHIMLDSITSKAERENGKLMMERYSGSHSTE